MLGCNMAGEVDEKCQDKKEEANITKNTMVYI